MNADRRDVLHVVRPQIGDGARGGGEKGGVTVNSADEQCEAFGDGGAEGDDEFGVRKFKKMQDPKAQRSELYLPAH